MTRKSFFASIVGLFGAGKSAAGKSATEQPRPFKHHPISETIYRYRAACCIPDLVMRRLEDESDKEAEVFGHQRREHFVSREVSQAGEYAWVVSRYKAIGKTVVAGYRSSRRLILGPVSLISEAEFKNGDFYFEGYRCRVYEAETQRANRDLSHLLASHKTYRAGHVVTKEEASMAPFVTPFFEGRVIG